MESITQLKHDVAAFLENTAGFEDAGVMAAFPAAQRDFPLRCPMVVVGLDRVEAAPGGFGGYWGERGEDSLSGSGARITLRFDLYAPAEMGGDCLHRLYEALCDRLLLRTTPFGFRRLWCGEIAYDKGAVGNRMTAFAALDAALLLRDETAPIERFDIRVKE